MISENWIYVRNNGNKLEDDGGCEQPVAGSVGKGIVPVPPMELCNHPNLAHTLEQHTT